MSIAPAFSPGPTSTRSPVEGRRPSRRRECLYAQCSDHMAPNMPSSTGFGGRPRAAMTSSYSGPVRPWRSSAEGRARVMRSGSRATQGLVAAQLEQDAADAGSCGAEEEEQRADPHAAEADAIETHPEA